MFFCSTDFFPDGSSEDAASSISSHTRTGEEAAVAGYNVALRKKYRKRNTAVGKSTGAKQKTPIHRSPRMGMGTWS